MKRILITGASGFVGSHLVEEALQRDLEVYAGVRKTSSREYLQDERIRFFEMDFSKTEKMTEQLQAERFDYIIHNAGLVTAKSEADYQLVNFKYVQNFTQALHAAGTVPKKFSFISSLAAYGPASGDDLSDFLKEEDEPTPINAYGRSKLAAEQHLHSLPGFPYVILRPTAVYGPREREILAFFKLLKFNLEGYVGTRRQDLTFVFVKDLVKVIIDATLSPHERVGYFVSDGNFYEAADLGRAGKRVLGKKTLRVYVPLGLVQGIAATLERLGKLTGIHPPLDREKVAIIGAQNWKCDIAPLKKDLNYLPQFDLEKGVAETLAWYKKEGWI